MPDSTTTCSNCPHPQHFGPCIGLWQHNRPGGAPGIQQCMCGHQPVVSQTVITSTSSLGACFSEVNALRAECGALKAELKALREPVTLNINGEDGIC